MSNWKVRAGTAALCLLLAVPARTQVPTLGDSGDMTSGAERRLGERIAREMYRDPDYLEDAVLDDYIRGIWQRLLAAARARGELTPELDQRFAWRVLLGKDRIVNAFALPGGWLGLQLGLLNVTESADELASVLAHELSHVTQRHISRMMTEETRQMPWVIGAMILGAIAASKNPEAGKALITGGQALAMQKQLNFSREMEREADRIGFGVMTQAGFRPKAFVTMFEKLQQASRLNDNGSFPYLRTHPMTTERIAEMQSRQQLSARPASTGPTDLVHAMMVGRSRVLSNPGVDNLRAYVSDAAGPAGSEGSSFRQAAALYAGALASAKLREPAAGSRIAARLAALVARDAAASREARLLEAEIALQSGDAAPGLALEEGSPARRPEVLLTAQAGIQAGRAVQAAERLQTWVAVQPKDGQAWQLLARAYAAQGQTLRSIRAEAEAQVAHLDYQAAIDRFKAAQEAARRGGNAPGDYIEASIIDTRERQVESLLREQALER